MKKITFDPRNIALADILTFSTLYMDKLSDVWMKIKELAEGQTDKGVKLTFLRHTGEKKEETGIIKNLNTADQRFDFGKYVEDGNDDKVFVGRTIRLDNVFGEIPLLLDFSYSTIFCFGKKIVAYRQFMEQVLAAGFKDQYATLYYKNIDGSTSEIYCLIKKKNRSNFETIDYRERLTTTENGLGVTLKGPNGIPDVHRFVSGNGYLYQIAETTQQTISHFDDGEVFGQTG
jgi:hypothetical protein